jgi:hypothetical protein
MGRHLRRRRLCWLGDLPREEDDEGIAKVETVLENLRANVDRVLSIGLGQKSKLFCGLKMRAGFKWKKVGPFLLGSDPESLAGEVLESGSVAGLGDASMEMVALAEETVVQMMELPISSISDGISDVPREGFALAMVRPVSP